MGGMVAAQVGLVRLGFLFLLKGDVSSLLKGVVGSCMSVFMSFLRIAGIGGYPKLVKPIIWHARGLHVATLEDQWTVQGHL